MWRRNSDWHRKNRRRLVTTDYIVDELLTLLRRRGERERALEAGLRLFTADAAYVHIETAFAFDDHFRQFGLAAVVP